MNYKNCYVINIQYTSCREDTVYECKTQDISLIVKH